MKVKILSSKSRMWWYYKLIGSEIYVNYFIDDSIDRYHHPVDKLATINTNDAVITELPESFCVKRCDNKENWKKYIVWLNKTYDTTNLGKFVEYLGYHTSHNVVGSDKPLGTEIHIDDMIKHIDYMETKDSITVKYENGKFIEVKEEFNMNTVDGRLAYAKKHYPIGCTVIEVSGENFKSKVKEIHTSVNNSIKLQFGAGLLYNNITGEWAEIIKEETNMETQKLSRQGLKEIHGVACPNWKDVLEHYGSRNPLEDYIELTQEEVNQMFNACTKGQLPIVSKYLKKEDDGSVDLSKIACEVYLDSQLAMIEIRNRYEYCDKAFWLNDVYFNWEIKKDSIGKLCLIPTKKK